MRINTEKSLTKSQRKKEKRRKSIFQSTEERKKRKRKNRKIRQNNKKNSTNFKYKESRIARDKKRIYGAIDKQSKLNL